MWAFDRIPSLRGKTYIVTGSNAGIGRVTARELARKGAHVIMACRSEVKTTPIIEALRAELGSTAGTLEFAALDLLSLKSVDAFSDAFLRRNLPLHGLILNAGIMAHPFALSADGIETQFATNHIAHFHLTQRLLPCLEKSAPSRVVVLTSASMKRAPPEGIAFDKINDQKSYNDWVAYGQSKLANVLFARELNARLEAKGIKNVYVNSVYPGVIPTQLSATKFSQLGFLAKPISTLYYAFDRETIDEDKGASTTLYVATDPEIEEKGLRTLYFGPIAQVLPEPIPQATDDALAKRLWEFSEALVKEKLAKP
ncbi:hypothetical protein DFJ73DRAFT_665115 [Zopfochytrium polystomum]|nr:hypothetical protein DFJ73DRAFT_665115 [Zopfochytrium polystomum]